MPGDTGGGASSAAPRGAAAPAPAPAPRRGRLLPSAACGAAARPSAVPRATPRADIAAMDAVEIVAITSSSAHHPCVARRRMPLVGAEARARRSRWGRARATTTDEIFSPRGSARRKSYACLVSNFCRRERACQPSLTMIWLSTPAPRAIHKPLPERVARAIGDTPPHASRTHASPSVKMAAQVRLAHPTRPRRRSGAVRFRPSVASAPAPARGAVHLAFPRASAADRPIPRRT